MRIILLPVLLLLFCSVAQASLKFDHYGVYVISDSEKVELQQYKSTLSRSFSNIARIYPEDNLIEFYIFKKKFNPDKVSVAQSALFSKKVQPLKAKVAPMDLPDTYKVSVQLKDTSMPFVMLRFGGFFSAKGYLVAITDIDKAGVDEIKASRQVNTREKLKNTRELLKMYPANVTLIQLEKELLPLVEKQNAEARQKQMVLSDKRAFKEAQASEKRYKDQKRWVTAYKAYLQSYPKGLHAEQAKSAIAKIEQSRENEKKQYSQQIAKFEVLINEYIDAINTNNQVNLEHVTVVKSLASKSLTARSLRGKSIAPIKVEKFHYSNKKTKDWVYVNVSGGIFKQLQLRLIEGDWKVYQYRL